MVYFASVPPQALHTQLTIPNTEEATDSKRQIKLRHPIKVPQGNLKRQTIIILRGETDQGELQITLGPRSHGKGQHAGQTFPFRNVAQPTYIHLTE